ncbi:hypothetical protein BLD48_12555 [Exiguobacterium sp. KRL4]|uniref:hypothetical protein n=1 Tax=Exiguobacterium sp. KRL4 TaxID=1914536 RepID=UPI0008F9019D|nr:hypothetical protein [Exiguobacterium sp. KRL4]OIN66085.1 hypothetical protein BLD48_12555 [Exiguobacterium sp. KRL4]
MKTRRMGKWMAFMIGMVLISGAGWFYLFESSKVNDFPIPSTGTVHEKAEGLLIKTHLVSEVEGPGVLYAMRIRQDGWKLVDREGLAAWYEKDGRMIELTTFDDELFLEPAERAGIEQ